MFQIRCSEDIRRFYVTVETKLCVWPGMCNKLGQNIIFDIGETGYIICTVFDATYDKFVNR